MQKTFAQLTKDIEELKAQAEAVRLTEVAGVISRIKEAIAFYELTADDLGLNTRSTSTASSGTMPAKAASPGAAKTAQAGRTKLPAKFRDAAGNSWTGRGSKPRWLVAALANGVSIDELRIAEPGSGDEAPAGKRVPMKKAKAAGVPKFRDADGHVWSGRGPRPTWLKEALAAGADLAQFAV